MTRTLICTLDDGPPAAATAAFGIWLGECIGARPLVSATTSVEDLAAVAAEHRAEIVVTTTGCSDVDRRHMLRLIDELTAPLAVLGPEAVELWLDPPEARRRTGSVIVAGSAGTGASITAARLAGRIAAGLGGSTVIAHVESRSARGLPISAPEGAGSDPMTTQEIRDRRALLAPALDAAAEYGAPVAGRLSTGGVAEVLADIAACERSPLIAVGSGRPEPTRVALEGSVSLELISRAVTPILIASPVGPSANAQGRAVSGRAARSRLAREPARPPVRA